MVLGHEHALVIRVTPLLGFPCTYGFLCELGVKWIRIRASDDCQELQRIKLYIEIALTFVVIRTCCIRRRENLAAVNHGNILISSLQEMISSRYTKTASTNDDNARHL